MVLVAPHGRCGLVYGLLTCKHNIIGSTRIARIFERIEGVYAVKLWYANEHEQLSQAAKENMLSSANAWIYNTGIN